MSESDVFDRVAEEVTHHTNWAKPERFAAAFRAEFAKRTCATCQHNVCRTKSSDLPGVESCARNVSIYGGLPSQQREKFSCHEWAAKPLEPKP